MGTANPTSTAYGSPAILLAQCAPRVGFEPTYPRDITDPASRTRVTSAIALPWLPARDSPARYRFAGTNLEQCDRSYTSSLPRAA